MREQNALSKNKLQTTEIRLVFRTSFSSTMIRKVRRRETERDRLYKHAAHIFQHYVYKPVLVFSGAKYTCHQPLAARRY